MILDSFDSELLVMNACIFGRENKWISRRLGVLVYWRDES